MSVAKQQGCRYIAGVYSSEYTIKVAQNLGYKLLDEVIHNKYVDPITGKMPFQDMISHNYSKAMYYDVDLSNVNKQSNDLLCLSWITHFFEVLATLRCLFLLIFVRLFSF